MAKATFNNKSEIATFLNTVAAAGGAQRNKADVSYYTLRKLQSDGYLTREKAATKALRGKFPRMFVVSGKGRQLMGAFKAIEAIKAKKAALTA